MLAQDILLDLRNGALLSAEAAAWFGQNLARDVISDAQVGAFAMGVCRSGLTVAARSALTLAMRDSGKVLDWALDGPIVDKHSTGGIGDCVSLLLAPALAACGAYVPMISGRGLGHTGGTLDKLEAIPGLSTNVDETAFKKIVGQIGCAIVGSTGDIAPADKRLYAVRDVTGTVKSVDLITASILSKKLAAGLDALVLDVKLGSGAFMSDMEEAETLARSLVETATTAGCPTVALLTDMNQPLAKSMGNALEVMEVMEALTGRALDPDLADLTVALGATVLKTAGLVSDEDEGAEKLRACLSDGRAAECFGRMIAALGGPVDFVERWSDRLPSAPYIHHVLAPNEGIVQSMDGTALGQIVVALGGGRRVECDQIDPSVGLANVVGLGDYVEQGEVIAEIHARTPAEADIAEAALLRSVTLGSQEPSVPPTVYKRIT
jgi:thymidine phosphorylase